MDRLAGLEQVIPSQAVRQALEATGRVQQRRCKLTHEVVCFDHINVLGRYEFVLKESVRRGRLRPLRNPDELDDLAA